MAITMNGITFYRTSEVCRRAGVSRATLFRWFKRGILEDRMPRDRRGWRMYTSEDVNRIMLEAQVVKNRLETPRIT
ncbi:MAG: MerR family transcriptional regulator [Chloroflexi bacterium]|nr:MerR family transcriptional regulator [Chloroflexota bacterium]MBI3040172.1 MerR family transcriptional regulator [Chloroflexota bacterium]